MRRFERITNRDGTAAWYIPMRNRSESYRIDARTKIEDVIGADGGYDLHGDYAAPLGIGRASMRFLLQTCPTDVDTRVSRMLQAVAGVRRGDGLRKLWSTDPAGRERRFTWARQAGVPQLDRGLDERTLGVSLEMLCPDPYFYEPLTKVWLAEEGYTRAEVDSTGAIGEPIEPNLGFALYTITTTDYDFVITNRGDAPSRHVIFRLEPQTATGFTNPAFTNYSSGYAFSSTRDAAATDDRLSINAAPGLGRARYSTNQGGSWADDTAALSLAGTQPSLMVLNPGDNYVRFTSGGTVNVKLFVWWLHAWRDP